MDTTNLQDPHTDVEEELLHSKAWLEKNLNTSIRHYVYPFGKTTKAVQQQVAKHYDSGIRIGSALNRDWPKREQFIYRIDADHLWRDNLPITPALIRKLTRKYWLNRLRGK